MIPSVRLIEIFTRFPDQQACIAHLEALRWGRAPTCPRCGVSRVARKADGARIGRWNCHACRASFTVLHGTVFHKTRIPLQKWFLAIGILLRNTQPVSSGQLARDLDLNQKSAWFLARRIRLALEADGGGFLRRIVDIDGGGARGH